MKKNSTVEDWLTTFWRILISPTPTTFFEESQKAEGKFGSAIGWLIVVSLWSLLLASLSKSSINVVGVIYGIVVVPLMLIFASSAAHFFLQRVFRNKQYFYDKFFYSFTAIFVVISIIFSPFYIVLPKTLSATISNIQWGYIVVLLVIAIKGITNIEYHRSVLTLFVSVIAALIVLMCAIPFLVSMLGGTSQVLR